MDATDRNKRVVEILTRKDGIAANRAAINDQLTALSEEQATLDAELHELLGVNPQPAASARTMTCSKCGEKGHNARSCPTNGQA